MDSRFFCHSGTSLACDSFVLPQRPELPIIHAAPHHRGFMAKEEPIQLEGQVTEVLPNATFRVELTNGHNVLATLGGNMRRFRIRVLQGDRVTIEVSPYDLTRGRIIFRHKT